jgi:LPXTG-motif cell wall-anchored protein
VIFEQLERWKVVILLGGIVALTRAVGSGDAWFAAAGAGAVLVGLFLLAYRRWRT